MGYYLVHITEMLEMNVIIEGCNSEDEAEERARELYNNEKIVLYPENFTGVNFEAEPTNEIAYDVFDMEHDEPF